MSVGTIAGFFLAFVFCGFMRLLSISQVVPADAAIIPSISSVHPIGNPVPITCFEITDIGISCPFCSQYSIILCPSEYVSVGFGLV